MAKAGETKRNKAQQSYEHLTPSERAKALAMAPKEGITKTAKALGRDKATISRLLATKAETYAEKIAKVEEAAVVRGYADKFEAGAEVLEAGRAVFDNFRYKHPDGTVDPSKPLVIRGREQAEMARTGAQMVKEGAAIMGWLVNKNEVTGADGGPLTIQMVSYADG